MVINLIIDFMVTILTLVTYITNAPMVMLLPGLPKLPICVTLYGYANAPGVFSSGIFFILQLPQ
jgi:hypothetical protein